MQFISILAILGLVSANTDNAKLPNGRIVGGYEVSPKFEYPWIVSLQYHGSHSCGGTLYNKLSIITAAHCVIGHTSSWKAFLHRHNLNETPESESGETHHIYERIKHPEYNEDDSRNDVSIWKMKHSGIKPTAIELDSGKFNEKEGTLLKVIGWGTTRSNSNLSDVLLEVKVPVFNFSKCKNVYDTLHKTQFCAGYPEGGKDSCQGDSGGPIFVNEDVKVTLVGVVSWGEGCAKKGHPGVYTKISAVSKFIKENA